MRITPNVPTNQLSIEQLVDLAAEWAGKAGDSLSTDICAVNVRACLDIARIKLAKTEQALSARQIELTTEANGLSEKLLLSNQEASKQNEENAKQMNSATQQLARSTLSLNRATWALVAFTAVQAIIAVIALFKK